MLRLQLSAKSGVTYRTLGDIERGKGRKQQERIRGALAAALDVRPGDIFTKNGVAR